LRRTRRRTQAGLRPGRDDSGVWDKADREDIRRFYPGIAKKEASRTDASFGLHIILDSAVLLRA
jgi:hypothetical protein